MAESILHTRHSARAFEDKPVDESLIREIIADAQLAPSWCNSQPWKAYVIAGDVAKKVVETHHTKLVNEVSGWAEFMPPQPDTWNPNNNDNIAGFLTAAQTNEGQNDGLGFIDANNWMFHAPVIIYITIPKKSTMFQAYDAGAFGYGICLSAHVHGLGTIPAYEFVRYPQEIHDVLDIPEDESILIGIGMGYAKESPVNKFYEVNKRAPLDSILTIKAE